MEINNISVNGHKSYSVFDGEKYVFYSNYYGILAVAVRVAEKDYNTGKCSFNVYTGNSHTVGGTRVNTTTIRRAVRRYVNKFENQFVKTKVNYEFFDVDLNLKHLEININI